MRKLKVYYVLKVALSALMMAALGAFALFAGSYAVDAFDILLIAMGLLSMLSNIPPFVLSLGAMRKKAKWEWINLILSLLGILLGVALILVPRSAAVLPVLLILYAVVLPAVRIFLVAERRAQLVRELPKSVLGIFVLAVSLLEAESAMFFVFGIAMIAIAALYLAIKLLTMRAYFRP